MTVLDNVIASAFLHADSKAEAVEEAKATIEFCELTLYRDKLAKSLPIASRKRLEIARALAQAQAVCWMKRLPASILAKSKGL